jgi:hypothetical protein
VNFTTLLHMCRDKECLELYLTLSYVFIACTDADVQLFLQHSVFLVQGTLRTHRICLLHFTINYSMKYECFPLQALICSIICDFLSPPCDSINETSPSCVACADYHNNRVSYRVALEVL